MCVCARTLCGRNVEIRHAGKPARMSSLLYVIYFLSLLNSQGVALHDSMTVKIQEGIYWIVVVCPLANNTDFVTARTYKHNQI